MEKYNEMRYEALAELIGLHHEENKTRIEDLKGFMGERFNHLDAHNKRQNGSITKAIQRIEYLEKESQERKLTCMKAVEILEKRARTHDRDNKDARQELLWVIRNKKKALFIFILFVLAAVLLVHYLDKYELIYKLINSVL